MTRAPASWIIREKASKRVIFETFNSRDAKNLGERYEAVPILEYLQEVNRNAKATAD